MSSPSNRAPSGEPSCAPDEAAEAEIQAANWEFGRKVGSTLESPLTLLAVQRDSAIRAAHAARAQASRERAAMVQLLTAEHEREVAEMCRSLQGARAEIAALRESLHAAHAEANQARVEFARVQAERDQAIADGNDLKLACHKQVESAQDEVSRLSWQLDEARRRLEDARDEAGEEARRLSELLAEMRRELDERNEEVRRLRACMTELDQEIHSRPPPAAAVELEGARRELESLRHRFVDAKREQSRLAHELALSRARRRVVISIPPSAADEPRSNSSES
ncbi:MAG: hypothetical protein JW940_31745 [Polyangiaceae bacterium]|nr:hypothetical protein [Polyangiaceae bacterium]